ncbi:MAG: hypothetical protein LBI45_07300 [Bacteroidales bacterium]|jgi:hypothetical protein|nr:hypothetical protein [Bacteroidales bacterium]
MDKKYIQKVIPSVKTQDLFSNMSGKELRKYIINYVKTELAGQNIVNEDTKLTIKITVTGGRKTAMGGAIYKKKSAVIQILPKLIQYAMLNNFGNRKEKDSEVVIGYLNFKVKCNIDEKLEHIRITVQMQKGGYFYYNLEINKIEFAV